MAPRSLARGPGIFLVMAITTLSRGTSWDRRHRDRGNETCLVWALFGNDNRIGTNGDGTSDEFERNVISGNDFGISIAGGSDNVVAGNYVGSISRGNIPWATAVDRDCQRRANPRWHQTRMA